MWFATCAAATWRPAAKARRWRPVCMRRCSPRPAKRGRCSIWAASPTSRVLNADGSRAGLRLRPRQCPARWLVPAPLRPALRRDGRWAASGHVVAPLLAALLAEPYFALAPPKSTGRDLFNLAWLDAHVVRHAAGVPTADVQATLAALTVHSVARHVRQHARAAKVLLVCGGGALNTHLMRRAGRPVAGRARHHHRQCRPARRSGRGRGIRLARATLRRTAAGQHRCRHRRTGSARARRALPGLNDRAARRRLWLGAPVDQAEKLDPQPQVVVAFGFLITNCAPCRSSL